MMTAPKKFPLICAACLLVILPMVASAKFDVYGTEDLVGDSGNDIGEPRTGLWTDFIMRKDGKGGQNPTPDFEDSTLRMVSDVQGEYWVGNNSSAPWDEFVDSANTGNQPSFHVTESIGGNTGIDSFYVGFTMEKQLSDFTSSFRILRDALPEGTEVFFGLRNGDVPSVLQRWDDGSLSGGAINNVADMPTGKNVGDVIIDNDSFGHISDHTGLDYLGEVSGSAASGSTHAPIAGALDVEQFEWIHFEINGTTGDSLFNIKANKNNLEDGKVSPLVVTDWVAYFVLPENTPEISGDAWGNNFSESESDLEQDAVFSWTVDSKSTDGYAGDNPFFDTPDSPLPVPEPSHSVMMMGWLGFLLTRRKRS